jgi:hypothetical protein
VGFAGEGLFGAAEVREFGGVDAGEADVDLNQSIGLSLILNVQDM